MADNKRKNPTFTTPKGIAIFPKLLTPDEYEGKKFYATKLKLSAESAAPLIALCEEETKAYREALLEELSQAVAAAKTPADRKKANDRLVKAKGYADHLPYTAETDENGTETGFLIFSFKTNYEYKKKDGTIGTRVVPMFDAKGVPCKVNPWGGSELKVSCELMGFDNAAAGKLGVSLRINAVQVIKLVQGGQRDASGYGFAAEEDGFNAADAAPDIASAPADGAPVDPAAASSGDY